jgi:hypothetical protein
MLDAIGWVATAIFSTSYFFRGQTALRWVQAVAACLWVAYGLAIGAAPVVGSSFLSRGERPGSSSGAERL